MGKRVSILDYIFAVGKVRTLEKFLVRQEVFEEAITAGLDEALRLFVESDLYGEGLLHIRDSQQLESVLNQELLKLKGLIRGLILDEGILCLLEFESLDKMRDCTKGYGSEFLSDYVGCLIDMHNIKTFLRLHILGEPQEKLKPNLISGGFIETRDFLRLYPEGLEAFLIRLEYVRQHSRVVDYMAFLREGIERLKAEGSFILLEKFINELLMDFLKGAKHITFGPEPVLAYYFAKLNEIKLIRMVIIAKLNEMPKGLIKERLSTVYA